MIDVFFCYSPYGLPDTPQWVLELRSRMADLCAYRWEVERGVNLRWLTPQITTNHGFEDIPFQQARRMYADENANSDIYVVTDDDCLLTCNPTVYPVLEIMEKHPRLGILALKENRSPTPMVRAQKPMHELRDTEDLIESHAVGGVRFCRKGITPEWPTINPRNPYQYDSQHWPVLVEAGYWSAYAKAYGMIHVGDTYSITWVGSEWRFHEGVDDAHARVPVLRRKK